MKERSIIFSTEMVKAILGGRKTQTRRVVSKYNSHIGEGGDWNKLNFYGEQIYQLNKKYKAETYIDSGFPDYNGRKNYQYLHVPYNFIEDGIINRVYSNIVPGQHLWVKERYSKCYNTHGKLEAIYYADDVGLLPGQKWYPSIFMPRWASRINLEVTQVRVQRVQEITEKDAEAEGVEGFFDDWAGAGNLVYKKPFIKLWDSINTKRGYSWESNPWVWAISFKVVKNAQ